MHTSVRMGGGSWGGREGGWDDNLALFDLFCGRLNSDLRDSVQLSLGARTLV
jgi:hypothetical protein